MELTLGEKIRTLRKGKMTQPELAEKIGVHEMTVSRWELGKRKPSINEIQKLAAVLGVPVTELLSDSPAPAPVMQVIPTQEKSTQERNTGMLSITFENGRKIEVPATPEGYAFLREVATAPAAVN